MIVNSARKPSFRGGAQAACRVPLASSACGHGAGPALGPRVGPPGAAGMHRAGSAAASFASLRSARSSPADLACPAASAGKAPCCPAREPPRRPQLRPSETSTTQRKADAACTAFARFAGLCSRSFALWAARYLPGTLLSTLGAATGIIFLSVAWCRLLPCIGPKDMCLYSPGSS